MRLSFALCLIALPLPLAAHPHIFVDTQLEIIVDADNRLTHVRVSWTYDDLYSLLLAEDFEIDQDGDGALSPKETALLTGFDMQWIEGYAGDLQARLGGALLTLSGPSDYTATMENGLITTTHLRAVGGTPVVSGAVTLSPFDPTYYTAYQVTGLTRVTGPDGPVKDCSHRVIPPDIDAALAELQQQLSLLDANTDPEGEGFPALGGKFADTVEITCPAR